MNVALQIIALLMQTYPELEALISAKTITPEQLATYEADEQTAYNALVQAIADAKGS